MTFRVTAPVGCLAVLLAAGAAQAQSVTTYVAGNGRDVGACPRTAPCRTLQYAIAQTAAGGEVDALDAGAFGPVTIGGPITIAGVGPGRAFIGVQPGGAGIAVEAGSADAVILRGIEIKGSGDVGSYGIRVIGAGSLLVADSVVSGVGAGLITDVAVNVTVSKSAFTDNVPGGIVLNNGGSLVLSAVKVSGSRFGVLSRGATQIVGCAISNNSFAGVEVDAGATFLKGSVLTGNGQGAYIGGPGTLRLDTTTITGNSTGINTNGNTALSYQNNNITDTIVGNITPVAPD